MKDSDQDGVMDEFDKDPNTPAGALVYGNGIPIDSDRDGLPDYKDKCPLESGPVENEGCPKSAKEFDYILINDTLDVAKREARRVVLNYFEGKELDDDEEE